MTNFLKVALCASLILGPVSTGFAQEDAAKEAVENLAIADKVTALAQKAGNGLKQAGSVALEKGGQVADWAKDTASGAYNAASEKAGQVYTAASDKANVVYAVASEKAAVAYKAASDKAQTALEWAGNKAPEGLKAWVANHPYLAISAVVAPIALLIGYKLCKAKPAKAPKDDK